MLALWQINDSDILYLQGDDRFTAFLGALLYATASSGGLRDDQVHTNCRVDVQDGGIDAAVDTAVVDDTTGWLGCPTAWQFKAQEYAKISEKVLKDEINKRHSRKLISEGYGYRLAVCDGMPDSKVREWEEILCKEAKRIAPNNARPVRVLAADKLAHWANRFPGVCAAFFHPDLRDQKFQVFENWQTEARRIVREYVTPDGLEPTLQRLAAFADLSIQADRPCVTVQGAAGVGKTRLVCEAMARLKGATSLVLYTRNEQHASRLAAHIAREDRCAAIIVADECGVNVRLEIGRTLAGHTARVRTICIDNSAQRSPTPGSEIVVDEPSPSVVQRILSQNFPGVPEPRRRAYAELSRGFVRFAVDLCQQNAHISQDGTFGSIPDQFYQEYLEGRLNPGRVFPAPAAIQAIRALALLPRVGFKDDMADELDQLAKLCNANARDIREAALSMEDTPGFVALAGRYLYVTPKIIAVAAFQRAWQAHIEHDPEKFLSALPHVFLERFHEQVQACGTPEMRTAVSDFFGQWVSQMTQQDLADDGKVRRLIQLVELQPDLYLPRLKRLVLETPREELKAMHVAAGFGRSPRRGLVWFCERAMALPEYSSDAEEMLLRLALAESEAPNVANNATHIWRQIFWPGLSGTAVPFSDRVTLLRDRLFSSDMDIARLASDALRGVFAALWGLGMRTVGPAVIMGRIPPDEWRPRSREELESCWRLPMELLVDCSRSSNQELSHTAQDIAVENLRNLIPRGFFGELKMILAPAQLPSDLLPNLLETVDFMLKHDVAGPRMTPELLAEVTTWRSGLVPQDIHARIVAAVSQGMMSHYGDGNDAPWNAELTALAQELMADRSLLRENLKWLCSDEARSASAFGVALGKLDKDAQLIKTVMNAIGEHHSTTFAVGYLSGLLGVSPAHASTLNTMLDSLVERSPRDAFQLITAGGDLVHAFERATKLVRDGRLGIEYLGTFDVGMGDGQGRWRQLTEEETLAVLELYAAANAQNNERALDASVHFLWSQTMPTSGRHPGEIFGNPAMARLARKIFFASAETGGYYWREAIVRMLPFDSQFVIKACTHSMLEGNVVAAREAETGLAAAASEYPEAVLQTLTPYVRDKKTRSRFRMLKYGELVRKLPGPVVNNWLDKEGVDGAIALARSLPAPYLDEKQAPIVPEPTLTVLRRFGKNREVFEEFCLGLHSFQSYFGDIAAQHMREATVAKAFLNHDMDIIRRWAEEEIRWSEREAERERQEQEELGI